MPVLRKKWSWSPTTKTGLGCGRRFIFSSEYKNGTATGSQKNGVIHIEHQQLDTTIEKNANLSGKATTAFVAASGGVRVVPFNLHRTLRVQSVTGQGGQPLSFVQEDKNDDADFYVILPKALSRGEKYSITTHYGGKDAVIQRRQRQLLSDRARGLVSQHSRRIVRGIHQL